MKILDCTLRDGGYYNGWNFPKPVVLDYLTAMAASKVDIVELGLRSLKNTGFKGASAYTTDSYIDSFTLDGIVRLCELYVVQEDQVIHAKYTRLNIELSGFID